MAKIEVYADGSSWLETEDFSGVLSGSANADGLPPALLAQMDILLERQDQRVEFGDAFDDSLSPSDWIARLTKHTGRAVSLDPAVYRKQLVIVGALALAAIEAYDRNRDQRRESP